MEAFYFFDTPFRDVPPVNYARFVTLFPKFSEYHMFTRSPLMEVFMRDLTNEILELIRRTSTDLPADVEKRLDAALKKEAPRSAARGAFEYS
jgi:hypothetical protein